MQAVGGAVVAAGGAAMQGAPAKQQNQPCPPSHTHRPSRSCAVSCSLWRVASLARCCSVWLLSKANTSVRSVRLVVNPRGASFCLAALRTTPPPSSPPPSPSLSAARLRMLPRFLRLANPAAGTAAAASLAAAAAAACCGSPLPPGPAAAAGAS